MGTMQQACLADTEIMQTEQHSACRTPFEDLGDSYRCPQCSAFKKRFAPYDAVTGKVRLILLHLMRTCNVTCALGHAWGPPHICVFSAGQTFCTAAMYPQRDIILA